LEILDEELEEQKFRINLNKLPFYYNKNIIEIKRDLQDIFDTFKN